MVRKFRADLTWPQVQQIAAMLKAPYGSMVTVLAQTGMRIGELCGLRWKWVNLTDHRIVMDGAKIEPYSILVRENWTAGEFQKSPKGKRTRQIPMTSTVWVALATEREKVSTVADGSLVFPNRKGSPLDAHNFENRHFKPACVKIGLPWASVHCLRHTLATMADQAKLTVGERMELLGHKDIKTTLGYTHADLSRVREKLEEAEGFVRTMSTLPEPSSIQ